MSASATYPSLADKLVVVTGGASGIGASIVRTFAGQRARVIFLDIDDRAAADLVASLDAPAHAPLYLRLDLTRPDEIGPALAAVASDHGAVAALVNNAAHDERHAVEDVTPAFWRDRLAVNLDHQFFCAQGVIPSMRAAGGGSIINMGSCSWRLGLGGMPAYVTAKAAIEGLTRALARDLGPDAIRVNCVIPGFIRTARQVERWLTPELQRTVLDGQCLKTLIEPFYVANLVAFLASDDSAMCTSQTYAVDGGWM